MKLKDIFTVVDQLKNIKGIEATLRRRQRNGLLVSTGTILLGLFETVREVKSQSINTYIENVFDISIRALQYMWQNFGYLVTGKWSLLAPASVDYSVLGFYVIVTGVCIYLLSRHTAFLLSQSREPFQYTFWIDRFVAAEDRDDVGADVISQDDKVHHFLHHDLMDMLNLRIARFSLLNEEYLNKDKSDASVPPPSHIHIDGHYTFRMRERNGVVFQVIQVMPRVRIGPPGNPSILTSPVEVELAENNTSQSEEKIARDLEPGLEIYQQLLEQVYSKVSSEVYKQLKIDIENKLYLFPTKYLRAVALYYEAEDFSRSSTIDSYDYAIELFEKALRYHDVSFQSLLGAILNRCRWLRIGIDYELMDARIRVDYAKTLIYRHIVSSLYGRSQNALYALPVKLKQVAVRLSNIHNKFHLWRYSKVKAIEPDDEHYPALMKERKDNRLKLLRASLKYGRDTFVSKYLCRRLDASQFDECKFLLFEAYVVIALVYTASSAVNEAKNALEDAKATFPKQCNKSALYQLALAQTEMDVALSIPLFIQSTELAPDFEIAQYLLAKHLLLSFMSKGEIDAERAQPIVHEFIRVLRINPGNIAAHAELGYLYWLIDELDLAQKQFEQGVSVKAIAQQTFIGELNYGLARLAAKHGDINSCYEYYNGSLALEPGLGAYSSELTGGVGRPTTFYEYISPAVLARYGDFRRRFKNQIRAVFARINETDLSDLRALREAFEHDQYRIADYISAKLKKTEQSGVEGRLSGIGFCGIEFCRQLNMLLRDPYFNEHMVACNNTLRADVERLKERVGFGWGNRDDNCAANTRLNRYLLCMVYPDWIAPYDDEIYFKAVNEVMHFKIKNEESEESENGGHSIFDKLATKKGLCDNNGKSISLKTINRAYSFVLNDHGNAFLNYVHRFGNTAHQEQAIEAYDTGIMLNPDNPIVYYNIENASYWRAYYKGSENTSKTILKRRDYLKNADRLMSWTWVTMRLISYEVRVIWSSIQEIDIELEAEKGKLIKQRKKEIEEKKEYIKILESQIRAEIGRYELMTSALKDMGATSETPSTLGSQASKKYEEADFKKNRKSLNKRRRGRVKEDEQFVPEVRKEIKYLRSKLEVVEKDIEILENSDDDKLLPQETIDIRKNIKRLENKLGDEKNKVNNSLNRVLNRTVRLSNLSALMEGLECDISGACISELLRLKIPEDQLESRDIDVLISWSQLILSSGPERAGLEACIKLLDFVSGLNPGSLDVNQQLLDAYEKLEKFDKKAEHLSPFLGERDIRKPDKLLAGIMAKSEYLVPEEFTDEFADIQKFSQGQRIRLFSDSQLKGQLAAFLNRLIQIWFFNESLISCETCSLRTRELIELAKEEKLGGDDLRRFNRRVLEEMFREEIVRSKVEMVRDRLCYIVKHYWLIYDPVHFIVLENWAFAYLTTPERKHALEKAIDLEPPSRDELEKLKNKVDEKDLDNRVNELDGRINSGDLYIADAQYKELEEKFPGNNKLGDLRERIDSARQRQSIEACYGSKWLDQFPLVTPIAMEVAGDLIPAIGSDGDELNPELLQLIESMRNRIEQEFGVKIPGIRFRGIEIDFPDGYYSIICNEIPLASGYVPLGKKLYTDKSVALESLDASALEEVSDPISGTPWFWIDKQKADELDEMGRQYSVNTLTYPVRQLESVLQGNLAEFLGIQEVYDLILKWCPDKSQYYKKSPAKLVRLSTVLRALVSDRVPITAFSEIEVFIDECKEAEPDTNTLINKVRLIPEVNLLLPGLDRQNYYSLAPDIETMFLHARHQENNHVVLAMQPEDVQDVLTVIREKVSGDKSAAIIVENEQLRPLVSQLTGFEFPGLPVITVDELKLNPSPLNSVTLIELES